MSKKGKLLDRLRSRPKDFTWDEACRVMRAAGYERLNRPGARRGFVHSATRHKVSLHEPHPRTWLLPYELDELIEAVSAAEEGNDERT